MSRIEELYEGRIMDLAKEPFQFYELNDATHVFTAYSPLCGDKFKFFLKVENNKITNCSFTGFGCAISKASSSTLVSKLINRDFSELANIINDFFVSLEQTSKDVDKDYLPFLAVKNFPERLGCVTLGWDELNEQLKSNKLTQ